MTQVAIISGAARGIGAATATLLARSGWSVIALDIAADDPTLPYHLATKDELHAVALAFPGRIDPVIADVRDRDEVFAAVADAEDHLGGLDAAVAAAGVIAGGVRQADVPIDEERTVVDVNLTGVLPNLAACCASKAGVTGFIRALAVELGNTGITANALSPGSTDTSILAESARLYALHDVAEFAEHHPIGRLIAPVEVAAAIAFLLRMESGAITGAVVPVDGEMTL